MGDWCLQVFRFRNVPVDPWRFFGTYHLHIIPGIAPFHKIGNWCKCIRCINRLCLCKCPIRLVFYTSQLVRRISIPTSGILSVNSIAILHCADAVAWADKRLRSYSSRSNWELEHPGGYFLKVYYGGKTRNLMNRQDQLPTRHWYNYEALCLSLSLFVSLMSTTSDAQQRKWGHMMISYVEITCQHHTFPACTVHTFLDFRFRQFSCRCVGHYILECSMISVYIFMCSWDYIPSKHNLWRGCPYFPYARCEGTYRKRMGMLIVELKPWWRFWQWVIMSHESWWYR